MTARVLTPDLCKLLKRLQYTLEVSLVCDRWHAAYSLSFRCLEEMMQERGVFVDQSTVHRRALKILPIIALVSRRRNCMVGTSWRMDETQFKVAGQWKFLDRAANKSCEKVEYRLTVRRDLAAARGYLEPSINLLGLSGKTVIDKSGANASAIKKSITMPAWTFSSTSQSIEKTLSNRIIRQ